MLINVTVIRLAHSMLEHLALMVVALLKWHLNIRLHMSPKILVDDCSDVLLAEWIELGELVPAPGQELPSDLGELVDLEQLISIDHHG